MKLTAQEVNELKDKCSYGGDYEGLYKRLEYDKPKTLRLNINDKDLLACWLEDDKTLSEEQKSIKNKLFDKNGNYR
jgi:hypothetical protein